VLEIGVRKKWLKCLSSMGLPDLCQKIIRAKSESFDGYGFGCSIGWVVFLPIVHFSVIIRSSAHSHLENPIYQSFQTPAIEIDTEPFQGLKPNGSTREAWAFAIEIDTEPFQGLKPPGRPQYRLSASNRNRYRTLSGIETGITKFGKSRGANKSKSIPNPFRD
jgi:hypothetical protein